MPHKDDFRNSTNISQESSASISAQNVDKKPTGGPDHEDSASAGYIEYRVEYRSAEKDELIYQYKSGNSKISQVPPSKAGVIFEVISIYKTTKDKNEASALEGAPPSISAIPHKLIRIHSPAIIHALHTVVNYYPSQDLTGDTIEITEPYAILVHHERELADFREKCNPDRPLLCMKEKNVYHHLGLLQDFLENTVMPAVREEQERNARGYYSFDWFWVYMKPGSTVAVTYKNEGLLYRGRVVESLTGGTFNRPSESWNISGWEMCYDGRYLGRSKTTTTLSKFDGERTTTAQRVVDFKESKQDELIKSMIENGRKFISQLTQQCKYYKGTTTNFPQMPIDGLVMVDLKTYYSGEGLDKRPNLLYNDMDSRTWISDCGCELCQNRRGEKIKIEKNPWAAYHKISQESYHKVTDHICFLCPAEVPAFIFKTRTWEQLNITGLNEPIFEEKMIDNLVMNPDRVDNLKALANSYARINRFGLTSDRPAWTADFVQGKGNGLIFLLHGRPGVGKTCTAECIAGYTKRPLMVLTASDVGTEPKQVEENLTAHFKRAKNWGAVLLIDEADVFMERRSTTDLVRNGLVAGFLRALEYYDGILFLTTNRVGLFDDAFISRIHVQMYYPDFSDEEREKVWKTFIAKLHKERAGYLRVHIGAQEYIESKDIRALKWNGREIRNAFQTAVSLAEYEAEKDSEGTILVTDKHLKSVVEMSRDFKTYLAKLHGGDEAKRAQREFERLDSFNRND